MRVLSVAVAVCLGAAVAAGPTAGAPATPPPTGLELTVTPVAVPSSLRQFAVYDAAGTLLRSDTFRVTSAGGNCCEKYVATAASGRLLELGGGYPHFSDDGGVTWHAAVPPVPLVGGEGAITAAPNGDLVGTAWDLYTFDRLVAYKYTAADGTWRYHETPVKGPFFDRPWVTVVKGPVHDAGR